MGFDETYKYYDIGNESNDRLQAISDWVLELVVKKFPAISKNLGKVPVTFLNSKRIEVPSWFLEYQDHSLLEKLATVFPILESPNEGEMQKRFSQIISICYPFVPTCSIDLLNEISK